MGAKAQGSWGPAPGVLGVRQSPQKHVRSLLGTCGGQSVHAPEGFQPVQVLMVVAVYTDFKGRETTFSRCTPNFEQCQG
jgi:hypothetical protein